MFNTDQTSRAIEAARYIETTIKKSGLKPGDKIGSKEQLRIATGVARATLNEALKLLYERGKITLRPGPGGGVFVSKGDPGQQLGRFFLTVGSNVQDVESALELRDYLEKLVIQEATRHSTEEDVAALYTCLEEMEACRTDTEALLENIWALHDKIIAITPNLFLRTTYRGLVQFIRAQVAAVTPSGQDNNVSYNDERIAVHRALVEIIAKGDLSAVDEVVARHNEAP